MKHGVHYYVDHAHERFYMLTNEGKDSEFKVCRDESIHPLITLMEVF